MSRTYAGILLGALVLSLMLVAGGQPTTDAGGFSELYRVAVADLTNPEIVMGLLEREGESRTPKHYHPGGEFGFVLEGAVSVEAEEEASTTISAGESFYQPPGEWHIVSTGAVGAKTVVFRIVQNGQPMVFPVE